MTARILTAACATLATFTGPKKRMYGVSGMELLCAGEISSINKKPGVLKRADRKDLLRGISRTSKTQPAQAKR